MVWVPHFFLGVFDRPDGREIQVYDFQENYLVNEGVGPRLGVAACGNSSCRGTLTPICLIISCVCMICTCHLYSIE